MKCGAILLHVFGQEEEDAPVNARGFCADPEADDGGVDCGARGLSTAGTFCPINFGKQKNPAPMPFGADSGDLVS